MRGRWADIFFDDFAYRDSSDSRLVERGWTVRSRSGGPGIPGAAWSADAVTFPDVSGVQVLRLDSSTDGTANGTIHAEISQVRKFHEGTYATRVNFDAPTGRDRVVQAFFTISPLAYDLDADYGELDIEYLPNGGWGEPGRALVITSWETYRSEPWHAVNTQNVLRRSFAGWHDLAIQVADGRLKYYVDGRLIADHGEPYYPETPMSININQWFISDGLQARSPRRTYRMLVDYVLFAARRTLAPTEISATIAAFRAAGVTHVDTV